MPVEFNKVLQRLTAQVAEELTSMHAQSVMRIQGDCSTMPYVEYQTAIKEAITGCDAGIKASVMARLATFDESIKDELLSVILIHDAKEAIDKQKQATLEAMGITEEELKILEDESIPEIERAKIAESLFTRHKQAGTNDTSTS